MSLWTTYLCTVVRCPPLWGDMLPQCVWWFCARYAARSRCHTAVFVVYIGKPTLRVDIDNKVTGPKSPGVVKTSLRLLFPQSQAPHPVVSEPEEGGLSKRTVRDALLATTFTVFRSLRFYSLSLCVLGGCVRRSNRYRPSVGGWRRLGFSTSTKSRTGSIRRSKMTLTLSKMLLCDTILSEKCCPK